VIHQIRTRVDVWRMYEYDAELVRVVDGDTVDISVDLGFHISQQIRVRLNGINAPELSTPAGKAAKGFLEGLLPVGTSLRCNTVKDKTEKYGRYLADLTVQGSTGDLASKSVNQTMLDAGQAIPYSGGKR
jgi:micrococcal nuclease